ncbi:hypothetical protein ON010_g13963 [Phytophthora cinnamomi]|nr:hypothetical protein ON010_g13963 [Phytophthora cinnamomi]
MQHKPKNFVFDAAAGDAGTDTATKSQVFVPTGDVPDVREVGYRQVNPMFESCEQPDVVFRTLHKAMRAQDVEFSCNADWTGDEFKFLGLTDSIRKECRSIDKDMVGLPELSFDIMADWSSPGELFPGALSVDSQELSMLLLEINSECPPFTRYEVAKRLKELCQFDSNRRALADLLKEQFVTGLQSMLKDDNEDIVRFAIYTILNFADDISTLNDLELPRLPETLRDILTLSQKESTKKLAGDLYKTINAREHDTETEARNARVEALQPLDECLPSWLERSDGRTRSSLVSAYVRELRSSMAIVKCLMPHEAAKLSPLLKVDAN